MALVLLSPFSKAGVRSLSTAPLLMFRCSSRAMCNKLLAVCDKCGDPDCEHRLFTGMLD